MMNNRTVKKSSSAEAEATRNLKIIYLHNKQTHHHRTYSAVNIYLRTCIHKHLISLNTLSPRHHGVQTTSKRLATKKYHFAFFFKKKINTRSLHPPALATGIYCWLILNAFLLMQVFHKYSNSGVNGLPQEITISVSHFHQTKRKPQKRDPIPEIPQLQTSLTNNNNSNRLVLYGVVIGKGLMFGEEGGFLSQHHKLRCVCQPPSIQNSTGDEKKTSSLRGRGSTSSVVIEILGKPLSSPRGGLQDHNKQFLKSLRIRLELTAQGSKQCIFKLSRNGIMENDVFIIFSSEDGELKTELATLEKLLLILSKKDVWLKLPYAREIALFCERFIRSFHSNCLVIFKGIYVLFQSLKDLLKCLKSTSIIAASPLVHQTHSTGGKILLKGV
ncbi:hypothetical protein VP01_2226g1 [Puccinia sorghi]|uniref:Uncharacterized protein n=1 Tax=Puccinia sorghi TaxID=27349 RepID=A0A0L6V9B3_9BASI|nr:hypothetical protein VP01_2226g1 [Puccinia sorghi]